MRTTVRTKIGLGAAVLALGLCTAALACGESALPTHNAIAEDPATARLAIAALRAQGPAGLRWLMNTYAADVERFTRGEAVATDAERARWKRIGAAIDAVAAQKDAAMSGLFWYTDLEQAKAAARREGKPILSLRLLGNLDTEFSCANSRFFRTVLYADGEVSKALRDRFVLHWQSVRPVPTVTIDMGDGRVICRTITGNSIHYVLDCDGRAIDALPGLYGAKAFLRGLDDAEREERALREPAMDPAARAEQLAQWHAARAASTEISWAKDLATVGAAGPAVAAAPAVARPAAMRAAPLATAKAAAEVNLVRAVAPRFAALEASTDDATWKKIAALPAHREDAVLGAGSRAMVRMKHAAAGPSARAAGALSVGKRQQEDPVLRVVRSFERSVAEDTVRNEYGFHHKIHQWFAARAPETVEPAGVDALNEKVYAELFLTPSGDPWLGLAPEDAYAALQGEGVR